MKNLIIAFLIVLMAAYFARAAPYLACNPYPSGSGQPDNFILIIDKQNPRTIRAKRNEDGSKQLYFDLGPLKLKEGSHTVKVRAVSLAGESDWAEWKFFTSDVSPFDIVYFNSLPIIIPK